MNKLIKLYTIGFTKKRAEKFFEILRSAGVKRLIDVRLNNVSQLAGFAKRDDLQYFLRVICEIDYLHRPDLAPTQALLDAYKKKGEDWTTYEHDFLALMEERRPELMIDRELLDGACLLCSEEGTFHCHRRLVAERFRDKLGEVEICNL